MRDWLSVIIVLLILGVLLDGIRRMRSHRKESLRMSRSMTADDDGHDNDRDLSSSEFPGGGPRVVGVRDTSDLANVNQNLRQSYAASKKTCGAPSRQTDHDSLKLDTPVPMLMDSVEDSAKRERHQSEEREPSLGSLDNLDDDYDAPQTEFSDEAAQVYDDSDKYEQELVRSTRYESVDDGEVHDSYSDSISERDSMPVQKEPEPKPDSKPVKDKPAPESRAAPDEVLVINVMARRGDIFAGPDLLDAMLSQGLRFGDMDIFHRHESADGRGKILFSVANMVVPGTFALEAMDDFESPGISMFLSLPIASDSLEAFNLMAESAQNIAHQLSGELKDENRSVMTRQTIEHGRQRVLEYERKRRLAKA